MNPEARVRPKFDMLFGDRMPGLDDILGGGGGGGTTPESSDDAAPLGDGGGAEGTGTGSAEDRSASAAVDDHPDDVSAVESSYSAFRSDVTERIRRQRADDPESVPEGAENFLGRVVREMMDAELAERGEERMARDMIAYETLKREEMETSTAADGADEVVKEVLGEAEDEAAGREESDRRAMEFREYERAVRERADRAPPSSVEAVTAAAAEFAGGAEGEDFDEVALRILESLLAKRTAEEGEFERRITSLSDDGSGKAEGGEEEDYDDAHEWDTDNLEDGIDELKRSIEAKKKLVKGGVESGYGDVGDTPESMIDWQMYRSIVSKMSLESAVSSQPEESDVSDKMRGWKEFREREDEMRRASGLTRGARMPFPWSDRAEGSPPREVKEREGGISAPPSSARKDPDEERLEYDRTALGILSDLARKTYEPIRAARLRNEIVELGAEIAQLEEKVRNKPPPSKGRRPWRRSRRPRRCPWT